MWYRSICWTKCCAELGRLAHVAISCLTLCRTLVTPTNRIYAEFISGQHVRSLFEPAAKNCTMKMTLSFVVLSALVVLRVLCQKPLQDVSFIGIGSVRPLRSSSSFPYSPPSHDSALNESEPEVASTSSASSSAADDGHASVTHSSSSSGADAGGVSTNFSTSSSSSAAYAIETIFTNSSAGTGDQDSINSSATINVSAVEGELIAALEVDQQVTGEGSPSFMHYVHRTRHLS